MTILKIKSRQTETSFKIHKKFTDIYLEFIKKYSSFQFWRTGFINFALLPSPE